MALMHHAILALDETHDEDSDVMGILDGSDDMPHIIRGCPVYWGIKRCVFG